MSWTPILEGSSGDRFRASVERIAADLKRWEPPAEEGSLFGGSDAGIALFYGYLALATQSEDASDTTAALLDRATDYLGQTAMSPSLYSGYTGIAYAVEHLGRRLFPSDDDLSADLDEILLEALGESPWTAPYDLVHGVVGLGVYALERLPHPVATRCLERVIERLTELSEPCPEGIRFWTSPELLFDPPTVARHPGGVYNVGLAHGIPGIVGFLALACQAGIAPATSRKLLDGTVRWLLSQRAGADSPSCFGDMLPAPAQPVPARQHCRLGWCYGDLGVAAPLLMAARCVPDAFWEQDAIDIARHAARRTIENAGLADAGLCHGAAGLGHIFNRFYQATREELFLDTARRWLEHAISMEVPGQGFGGYRAMRPESPGLPPSWVTDPGFLTGTAGVGLAYLAALYPVEPDWDRVLLVTIPPR